MSFEEELALRREDLAKRGLWRELRVLDKGGPSARLNGNSEVVQYASNDYLGLSQHPDVIDAATRELRRSGAGGGASRLVVGNRPAHIDLEADLAAWKGTESALVFSSGYAANVGVLSAIAKVGPTAIVSDELNHASIIDGGSLSKARVSVYSHLDVYAAERAIAEAKAADASRRCVLVTDSVFSMDGDVAPVQALSSLCADTGSVLVVDDAHNALDQKWELDPAADVIWVGTLSKTLGAGGGFVAGSSELIGWLINAARSFVFSTAIPPSTAAAARAALEIVLSTEGESLRTKLRSNIDVIALGHTSAVVPVMCGTQQAAISASEALLEHGILVPAIRPPTVPEGTSRLRVALSATHSVEQVEKLSAILSDLGLTVGPT